MFDFTEFKEKPIHEVMQKIQELAFEQKNLEKLVEEKEEEWKEAKRNLARVSEKELPALMDEIGSEDFTTSDGIRITVKEDIRASITPERAPEALGWLEENEHGDLIKREFKVIFGRNEEDWAKEFQETLAKSDRPLNYEVKRGVHASTLSAFVREQLKEGADIPLETFSVLRQRKTAIKVKI